MAPIRDSFPMVARIGHRIRYPAALGQRYAGGLDMRKTVSTLVQLWKGHSGATPPEVAITIAITGVILARIVAKVAG